MLIVIIMLHDCHQHYSCHGHGLQILMVAQLAITLSCQLHDASSSWRSIKLLW